MNYWLKIKREARRADTVALARLYEEVYGAAYSGSVTEERARESIVEACDQMIHKERHMAKDATINDVMDYLAKIEEMLHRALKTPGHIATPDLPAGAPGAKKRPETELHVDGKGKPAEAKEKAPPLKVEDATEVSDEELREVATKFTSVFSMNDLLKLNQKFGGKKLSEIPKERRAELVWEMKVGLARHENGDKAEDPKARAERTQAERAASVHDGEAALVKGLKERVTIDDIRRVGQEFVNKNGDPAFRALLKAIGKAGKISEVDAKHYPALFEALSNA